MSALYEKGVPHPDGYRDVDVSGVAAERSPLRRVDVREPAELEGVLGHIEGVERVPLASVGDEATHWGRDTEVLLICRSGGRSARAAAQLARQGFTRVMNMRGGMLAWNEAGLPVVHTGPAPRRHVTDVLDELLTRMRELGSTLPAASLQGLLKAHGGQPTHAQFLSLLDVLQTAGQAAVKNPSGFERLLRECRDLVAVSREARAS